ncbi:peptidoglycan-binding protein [Mesorhizobium sp. VNQ89]|uniref:peptidoglycan-binding protein n=1 Tax=Mesorhizobium quangtriensis TaxID=3157709 RepID=UPI0032B73B7A
MNSKRSYLDTVNAGRQRRSYASLEQLNRSLESLEHRLERNREEASGYEPQPAAPSRGRERGYELPRTPAQQRATERGDRFDSSYQTIARDLERVRRDSDSVEAFGKIAAEIKGLREELRHQMASSLSREFDTLRSDFQRINLNDGRSAGKLGNDVERLSNAVQLLSERGDDRNMDMMRREIEGLKAALGAVAREETVRSVDRRFDDLENRIATGDAQSSYSNDLLALTDRLEQISQAVGKLPGSLPLGGLEEKVRTLAGALDNFIDRQDGRTNQIFTHIEERLDEISRAIVSATMATQQKNLDPEPFERIEARISALAKQIEEVTEDRPGPDFVEHLQALARRVDALASQTTMPDEAIERLARQISVIADKIDRVPSMPDANEIFTGIEQRLDVLSNLFEKRQEDAIEQGNALFRELERRLNDVAERIDGGKAGAGFDGSAIMQEIDRRFSALTETLGGASRDGLADEAIRALETRLENISKRLDQSASQFANIDPELVRNLEAQVSGLSQHLAQPGAVLPEFVDISPRLVEIEKSISQSRESILDAARAAAETAVRSLAESQPGSAAVGGFADELKAIEDLTRRSDERNSKTFEAIHDTLLKIVDRMGTLEREAAAMGVAPSEPEERELPTDQKIEIADAPSIDADIFADAEPSDLALSRDVVVERTPAQAAAAAAMAALGAEHASEPEKKKVERRSLFAGLVGALKKKGDKTTEKKARKASKTKGPELAGSTLSETVEVPMPELGLDMPLDPKAVNRPLEPGSGAPDLNAIMKRVRDDRTPVVRHSETDAGKSDFIAAARRAAQAAAAEADVKKRKSDVGSPVKALRIGDMLKSRRKHLLLGATALVTALAGLQLGKNLMGDSAEVATVNEPAPTAASQGAPQAASMAPAPVKAAPPALSTRPAEIDQSDDDISAAMTETQRHTVDMAVPTGTTPADEDGDGPQAAADRFGGEAGADDMPMHDVMVAAVSTVGQIANQAAGQASAAVAIETVMIDIPADAGPLALREAAAAGDAKALFAVATHYADGRGGKPDMAKAAEWYQKSADLGFAPAQYRVGNMYEKGIGVERDLPRSRDLYLKAAEKGNAAAMHNLAVLYAMGAAGGTDNDAAAKWFLEAAEFGVKDSQFNLGILSAKGVGMKQSLEESYKWFALVAKTGDKDAATKRDEIGKALRPEQLERARAATELWRPKALLPEANSVDIPAAWQESAQTTASIDLSKAVKTVQQILNKNGYDAGAADGKMGGKTRTAIAQFQKDNGLEPSGKIDETLVRTLMGRG